MLLDQLKEFFNCSEIEISERVKIVNISCICNKSILHVPSSIQRLLLEFPTRDDVTISFINEVEKEISFSSSYTTNKDNVTNFLDDIFDDEFIKVKIKILKPVEDSKFSIYSFVDFTNDLNSLPLKDFLEAISSIISDSKQGIIFDMLDESKMFWTKNLKFIPHSQVQTNIPFENRCNTFRNAQNNIFFRNIDKINLCPTDFILESDYLNNPLTEKFNTSATLLSLVYVANSSNITANEIDITLTGQQTISESIPFEKLLLNKNIISMFSWIYDQNFSSDKLTIARNIISLHCKQMSLIYLDERTLASIHANFNLYLKENVDRYLGLKKEVSAFLYEIVGKTSEYSLQILSGLKSNFLAMTAFLLTVLLSNLVSTQPLNNIFTKDITIISEFIIFVSFLFLLISYFEHAQNMKSVEASYDLLKNSYKDILSEDDIQAIFKDDKIKKDTFDSVKLWTTIYISIWISLLIALLIIVECLSSDRFLTTLFQMIF